jgi:hypothetical protein
VLPFTALSRRPFSSQGLHESLMSYSFLLVAKGCLNFLRWEVLYNKAVQLWVEHRQGQGYIQKAANDLYEGAEFRPREACAEWLGYSLSLYALGPIYPALYLCGVLAAALLYCS